MTRTCRNLPLTWSLSRTLIVGCLGAGRDGCLPADDDTSDDVVVCA